MTLKKKTFSAVRWTAAASAIRVGLQIAQTMVLARLLAPADFGLMAMVLAVVGTANLLADLGFSRSIIQRDALLQTELSSLYWTNLCVGIAFMLMLAAIAPTVATVLREPEIAPLLVATGLMFPITALGQQFRVLAEKELRFAELTRIEICANAVGFLTALTMALVDAGASALVGGLLASAAASSLLAGWLLSPGHRPILHFKLRDTYTFLRSGSYLVADSVTNALRMQLDVFIGGLLLGPSVMGVYALPRDLSLRIAFVINPIVTRVGFPVMAKLQNDRVALCSVYLQTLRMTTSASFPAYMALAAFAEEIVALLLGPGWDEAGAYLRILAIWGMFRSVGNPVGSLIYAVGLAKLAFFWNLALLLALPPLLWTGIHLAGLEGLAWTLLAVQIILLLPAWRWLAYPACHVRLVDYLRQIAVPFFLSATATAAAYGIAHSIGNPLARLMVGILAGAVAYLMLSWWFNRTWMDAMLQLTNFRSILPIRNQLH